MTFMGRFELVMAVKWPRVSDVIGGKLSMDIAAIRESVRTKLGRDAFLASICKLYTDHPLAERMLSAPAVQQS
jgi:hypothetical protein